MTHWMSASVLCRSRLSVSSATLTIVVSRIDMIDPRITTKAIRQTWLSIRSTSLALNWPAPLD
jgi:hypothetical protein